MEDFFRFRVQHLQQILHLSRRVQSLPNFQAPCPYGVLKLLKDQREVSFFADCFKMYNGTIIEFGFRMISRII